VYDICRSNESLVVSEPCFGGGMSVWGAVVRNNQKQERIILVVERRLGDSKKKEGGEFRANNV